MNKLTEELKYNLMDRSSQYYETRQNKYNTSSNYQPQQERFMHHFESINNGANIMHHSQNQQENFTEKLEQYGSTISIIDRIVNQNQDAINIPVNDCQLADKPSLPNFKPVIVNKIKQINKFFEHRQQSVMVWNEGDNILFLKTYSQVLSSLGRKKEKKLEDDSWLKRSFLAKSKFSIQKSPLKQSAQKQIQVDTQQLEQTNKQEQYRLKKADIILIEILKEKKRKRVVGDYFSGMEAKLLELLDYILQGEPQYADLDATTKMKEVLKRLDQFKGKSIDGESKINLLRIFFEQFRNLKNQKQSHEQEISIHSKLLGRQKQIRQKQRERQRQKQKSFTSNKKWQKKKPIELARTQIPKGGKKTNFKQTEDSWIGSNVC